MTKSEIEANGADINKAVYDEVAGKYCFYDVTYNIGESITCEFPSTGANQNMMLLLLAIVVAAMCCCMPVLLKRQRRESAMVPAGVFSKR